MNNVCGSPFVAEIAHKTWHVDGVEREALVYIPASSAGAPAVFCFHGHGGNMRKFTETYPIHTLWPEAIVVWPQGLPTPGKVQDFEGKMSGWQNRPGMKDDRDIRFVDAMLDTLRREYNAADNRIYATGFSNGGGFTYVLWATRRSEFAAFAPMANITDDILLDSLKPRSVFVAGGTLDEMVTPAIEAHIFNKVKKINQCTGKTEQVGDNPLHLSYESAVGLLTQSYYYPRGHEHDPKTPGLMVSFLRKVDQSGTCGNM